MNKLKSFKKGIEDVRQGNETALEASKKELTSIPELPELEIPDDIVSLQHLEHLNLFNNWITVITPKISELRGLRSLILGMNRLDALPRGFGAFPTLEVLDLTYNNLATLPDNFFNLGTLRALYLSDNNFEYLPAGIGNLLNLEILALRDNDLIYLPPEIGKLTRLKELHIQGNRLTVLPPELGSQSLPKVVVVPCFLFQIYYEIYHQINFPNLIRKCCIDVLGNLDLTGPKQVAKLSGNYWVSPIEDQLQVGLSHVFDYIRSETYKFLHDRHLTMNPPVPPKADRSRKISRKR
eukprot:TsM_000652500 transcript=TsM_000652500 gene=TsM_000652500